MALSLLTEEESGLRHGEYETEATRAPLNRFLPYRAYDEQTRRYYNSDDTVGLIWECAPLAFAGEKPLEALAGLIRQDWPSDTVMSFTMFPDDDLEGLLGEYLRLKTRNCDVVQEGARRYADHLRAGRNGLAGMSGIPVRNFRLFVAIKSGTDLGDDRVAAIEEALKQAALAPRPLPPGDLLAFLRWCFNKDVGANPKQYDQSRYLAKQVIGADEPVHKGKNYLRFGGRFAACITPKTLPGDEVLRSLNMNKLIGGFSGPQDDGSQLCNRFVWTTSVFFKTEATEIRRKASIMMAQKAGGTIAKEIGRRVNELSWVLEDLERDKYCNVITAMWIFGDDEDSLNRGVARARSLWEGRHFVVQRETRIAPIMLIASLPFGLYTQGHNISIIDRDFCVSAAAAAHLMPIQADFAGRMRPVLLYVGRKGQLATIDMYDSRVNNHNFLVCAGSGAGKSFNTNVLVNNYYGTGALVRIVDIGYSYEKQCLLSGGRYIDVGEHRPCLNPFTASGKGDDARHDELTIANIILTMVYSSTGTASVQETHFSLAKDAVRFAKERDGGLLGIDHVAEYLKMYPRHAGDNAFEEARPIAQEMAFNLRDFTSRGKYGSLFNGKSTFDISSDEFVVLELEQILNDQELFKVIAMQVINAITQDLYMSDRSQRRFMLFDEAWKYFNEAPMIANIIQEGYRRARKYGGSTGIITQSPLDLLGFGPAGKVVKSNSAFRIYMESDDYIAATRAGILEYSGLLLDLAMSVRNNRPRFSEILFDTPLGAGVGRLCVDRWTYWQHTTTAHEVAKFKHQLSGGRSPRDAISALAEEAA